MTHRTDRTDATWGISAVVRTHRADRTDTTWRDFGMFWGVFLRIFLNGWRLF